MSQPQDSHFTYEKLHDLLMAVLSGEVATKQAIRVVRYALEIEALSRVHSDRATGREIMLLADALAEPGSPRLAVTYEALAGIGAKDAEIAALRNRLAELEAAQS